MFKFLFRGRLESIDKNIFKELNECDDFKCINGKVLGIYIDDKSIETIRKFKESSRKIKIHKCMVAGIGECGIFSLSLYTNFGELTVLYEEGILNSYLNKSLFIWSSKLERCYLCDEIYDNLDKYSILHDDYLRLQYINRICRMNSYEFNVVCNGTEMFDIV